MSRDIQIYISLKSHVTSVKASYTATVGWLYIAVGKAYGWEFHLLNHIN